LVQKALRTLPMKFCNVLLIGNGSMCRLVRDDCQRGLGVLDYWIHKSKPWSSLQQWNKFNFGIRSWIVHLMESPGCLKAVSDVLFVGMWRARCLQSHLPCSNIKPWLKRNVNFLAQGIVFLVIIAMFCKTEWRAFFFTNHTSFAFSR
jgi:hypothetical protein